MNSLFGIPMDTLMAVFSVAFVAAVGIVAALALRERIFLKLALRNIQRRPGRAGLIVAGLMLGTTIVAAAFNTGDTMTHTVRSTVLTSLGNIDEIISVEGAETEATVFVEAPASDIEYFDEHLFPFVEEAAADSDLIDGVAPAIIEPVAVQDVTTRQNEPRATVFATDPDRMDGFGEIKDVAGGTLSLADLGPSEIYLNDEAANELNASAGDELVVFAANRPTSLRVQAIAGYDGSGTDESAILMPLAAAQELLDKEGRIKHILVSNEGDALSGADHTDDVIAELEPTLTPLNLQAEPSKQDALDLAETLGDTFTTFFVTFGSFSIIAGILLIFLIFVMLAEERKSEMGMARAVGTKRGHLIQMFLYEGLAYDLAAAAVGAFLGLAVAYGMVFVMTEAFATFGLDIRHDFRARSMVVAYTLGVLLTFLVVTISAWRVSVLNIVRAIRNLPDPVLAKGGGLGWVFGVLAILLGALMTIAGVDAEQGAPFMLGTSLVLIGSVPILRRLEVPDRVAYTIPGVALVVWWLLPARTIELIVGDLSADFSIFIMSGLMVVTGATWTVIYNSDLLLRAIMALFGRIRWLAPILKTAVSYPLTSRFRTGMTLAMFTLVVFTVVVMSTVNDAFRAAFDDVETYGGGFDIRATTVTASPVEDLEASIGKSENLNEDDFEVVASQSVLSLELRQANLENEGEFESYPVRGLDDEFIMNNNYEFAIMAEGYESAEEVWQAVAENPGLAVMDPLPVPRRDNFSFGPGVDFRLEGFFIEDDSFEPIKVEVFDPQTSTTFSLTIIGVLTEAVELDFILGVSTSQEKLPATLGERVTPTVHMLALREGVDASATAAVLESAFLENGMEADSMKDKLEDAVAASNTFNYILQGFMGLGLIVGVAALGVISARSVVERRHEIGVLRSIGFKGRMVQLSFLLESSFVALIGIVMGSALGLAIAFNVIDDTRQQPSWENISFAVPWLNLLIIFAIVYAAALVASYLPARQASSVYPAAALRYE
jgi:putative ABC transport system permease protein